MPERTSRVARTPRAGRAGYAAKFVKRTPLLELGWSKIWEVLYSIEHLSR
jgi:hypothetical protein